MLQLEFPFAHYHIGPRKPGLADEPPGDAMQTHTDECTHYQRTGKTCVLCVSVLAAIVREVIDTHESLALDSRADRSVLEHALITAITTRENIKPREP